MSRHITRRSFIGASVLAAAAGAGALSGCSGSSSGTKVRIGTMPTEDILPMWVAESEGLFVQDGLDDVEIVVFESAQNLSAAITAGEVDLAMTDPMRAVKLTESGASVVMEWITLGADASQGRFGVLAGENAEFDDLEGMASFVATADFATEEGGSVAVASNTVPEYVFDKLCSAAGVEFGTVEIPSLADRYSMVASGEVLAAALPGSLLALGEASGLKVIADDTKGDNLSQSVMVATASFAADNAAAVEAVAKVWDMAVDAINASPEDYRALLVEKANLNSAVADSYPISTYPHALDGDALAHPAAELIEPQIAWMKDKGYSDKDATYDASTGAIEVA